MSEIARTTCRARHGADRLMTGPERPSTEHGLEEQWRRRWRDRLEAQRMLVVCQVCAQTGAVRADAVTCDCDTVSQIRRWPS